MELQIYLNDLVIYYGSDVTTFRFMTSPNMYRSNIPLNYFFSNCATIIIIYIYIYKYPVEKKDAPTDGFLYVVTIPLYLDLSEVNSWILLLNVENDHLPRCICNGC